MQRLPWGGGQSRRRGTWSQQPCGGVFGDQLLNTCGCFLEASRNTLQGDSAKRGRGAVFNST